MPRHTLWLPDEVSEAMRERVKDLNMDPRTIAGVSLSSYIAYLVRKDLEKQGYLEADRE